MEHELNYPAHNVSYFIPQEEMEDSIEFPEQPRISYYRGYTCMCGHCLSCVGLSEKDFM